MAYPPDPTETRGEFAIKDSGSRQEFAGGMVRDTTEGKANFLSVRFGPMLRRWAEHLTKGRAKYPDPQPGVPNWTLAQGAEELLRAKESAARHFEQWLAGERDEDHASAVFFNINLAEYVLERDPALDPALGTHPNPAQGEPEVGWSKPWKILKSAQQGGISGEGFGIKVSEHPLPVVGDRVRVVGTAVNRDSLYGVGQYGTVVQVDAVKEPYPYRVLVDRPDRSPRPRDAETDWTPYRAVELELVGPEDCNAHCLDCACDEAGV